MAAQKQIDAARRNGARSRGPVTPEGRAKSSRNSLKHGITAKTFFILANESEEKFDKVVDGFFQHYQPANDIEEELCVSIAHAHWRIRRLAIIETGLLDKEMLRQDDGSDDVDEGIRLAEAFETLAGGSALRLVTQYETRLYRTLHRLIDRLEKIQQDRKGNNPKNEPDSPNVPSPSTSSPNEDRHDRPRSAPITETPRHGTAHEVSGCSRPAFQSNHDPQEADFSGLDSQPESRAA